MMKKLTSTLCAIILMILVAFPTHADIVPQTDDPTNSDTYQGWVDNTDGHLTYTDITGEAWSGTTLPAERFIYVNEANFPDPLFRQLLLTDRCYTPSYSDCNISGRGMDGILTASELALIDIMNISRIGINSIEIADLTGIMFFTALKDLKSYNSDKIECFDISGHPSIEKLSISGGTNSLLTEVNVSNCPNLKNLACSMKSLMSLNLENCTGLERLDCRETKMTSLDLSTCTSLILLDCSRNFQLTSLDLSNNHNLWDVDVHSCPLTSLALPESGSLRYLSCGDNMMTFDDITNFTSQSHLIYFHGANSTLGRVDLTNKRELTLLNVDNAGLSTLDLSGCPNLASMYCGNNSLTDLDLTVTPLLQGLTCNNNQLKELDLSQNTILRAINCSDNELVALNLTKNTAFDDSNPVYSEARVYPAGFTNSATISDYHNSGVKLGTSWNSPTVWTSLNYSGQKRALGAEVGHIVSEKNNTLKKFYYFRLKDEERHGEEVSLPERMKWNGVTSFDLSKKKTWGETAQELVGRSQAAAFDEINQNSIIGTILVLTPSHEDENENTASGTVTYTYNVSKTSTNVEDYEFPFTLNWTAEETHTVTGIVDIDADKSEGCQLKFYNLEGQCSDVPFEGVNIVVKTTAAGKTTSNKVIF